MKCDIMKCDIMECFELAVVRVYTRGETVGSGYTGYYCESHAKEAARAGEPESVVMCPCCNCLFGVG